MRGWGHDTRNQVLPYDDPQLLGTLGAQVIAEWNMHDELGRVLRLTDGEYKCPRCGNITLSFIEGGILWD